MKKIISIVFICLLLIPIVSVDAKTKSSSSSMPSTSVNKSHNNNSTSSNNSNNTSNSMYSPYHKSRSYYGGFSFPWLWFILMDSDEEQVQTYCVPLADINGDGVVDDSEATEEYQNCVKQYSSFSFMGFLITLLIVLFIFRIIILILNNRKRK